MPKNKIRGEHQNQITTNNVQMVFSRNYYTRFKILIKYHYQYYLLCTNLYVQMNASFEWNVAQGFAL